MKKNTGSIRESSYFRKYKKGILILLIVSPFINSFGAKKYVSPSGSDSNDGSIGTPYLTIPKAVTNVAAGDTIYVRGGNHTYSTTISISKSGTSSLKYNLWAYPGERPVLNYSSMAVGSSNRGVNLSGSYWFIKGLDFYKAGDNGMNISGSNNRIEYCSFYENYDTGLQLGGGASNNQVINCDSYYNCDPGQGNADGFSPKLDVGTGNYFYGCRSWQNSDDGWDGYMRGADNVTTTIENCWCFMNGYLKSGAVATGGNGNGFKMGGGDKVGTVSNADSLRHNMILKNCLCFDNHVKGYDQNNNRGSMTLLNCTAYRNGTYNFAVPGFIRVGSTLTVENCISLASLGVSLEGVPDPIFSTNSWPDTSRYPPGVTSATNADFITIDTVGVRGPRKADGSLPDITFMHLAAGSQFINAGTNVGLPYNGSAPDLGAFETTSTTTTFTLAVTATNGSVTKSPNQSAYDSTSVVQLTATPISGFHFISWSGDLTGSTNPANIIMNSNKNITANFAINSYSLIITATNGTVTKIPDQITYDSASVVQLTAMPASGYSFTSWSGDVTGSTNPVNVTMNAIKNVTANFTNGTVVIAPNDVVQGWNLVSVPLLQSNDSASVIFNGKFGDMFGYSGGSYAPTPTLSVGKGYWVYFTSARNISITGTVQSPIEVSLTQGWNLIGSCEVTINTSALSTNPSGQLFGDLFAYSNGGYTPTTTIAPGQGVWVYSLSACTLTFP